MTADVATVSQALGSKGTLIFRPKDTKVLSNSTFGSVSGIQQVSFMEGKESRTRVTRVGASVEPGYKKFDIKASSSSVVLQEVFIGGDGSASIYDPAIAIYAVASSGEWLYSDGFSGCVWFIFRDMNNRVHGVHAPRASGLLEDPRDFYKKSGCKLLYVFDTSLRMSEKSRQGQFAVMLCHVGQAEITCWAVARDNQNVVSEVLDHRKIPNWRRYELANPTILRGNADAPKAPEKKGLLARIKAKF